MITYDDSNLRKLFEELEPKRRVQALKGGFRKAADFVRKTAISELRGSGINTSRGLEKGIRRIVYKKRLGFSVTVAFKTGKKEAGFHTNRRGLRKPVLLWAEEGTAERYTNRGFSFSRRKGKKYRGRMPKYGFMEKAKDKVESRVTEELRTGIVKNVERIAKKYGCH